LFFSLFHGLKHVYGTYSPRSGKHWQIKGEVTEKVIENHLKGKQPYGFYPLTGDKTTVGIADFDDLDPRPPIEFIKRAEHYGLTAYLEKSKSKGYHVWLFFPEDGVNARKLRIVLKFILNEIDSPETEVFPKQDSITNKGSYGNFINAPIFGKYAHKGKTIFVHPDINLSPFKDQFEFLKSIIRNSEDILDALIEENELETKREEATKDLSSDNSLKNNYGLPICAQKMLENGVTYDQRIACFRLAVNLKKIGLPLDEAIAILMSWRVKNKPSNNKRIITPDEVIEQAKWAYSKEYKGYGCDIPIIEFHCDSNCKLYKYRN
ncbi:MAG: hypothetical protein KDC90_08360, partial [Ignavibacteriae bacterium]|nr:hypothetical protein [Ignavibacteriota bacterium]